MTLILFEKRADLVTGRGSKDSSSVNLHLIWTGQKVSKAPEYSLATLKTNETAVSFQPLCLHTKSLAHCYAITVATNNRREFSGAGHHHLVQMRKY